MAIGLRQYTRQTKISKHFPPQTSGKHFLNKVHCAQKWVKLADDAQRKK